MQAWLVFTVVILVLCLLYPPLIGFCAGVAWFYVMAFMTYKALGG